MTQFTIPGLTVKQSERPTELLQRQLSTYNDLHLTLKHIHWNMLGPNFIRVHEMIDPQAEAVRQFADDVAGWTSSTTALSKTSANPSTRQTNSAR